MIFVTRRLVLILACGLAAAVLCACAANASRSSASTTSVRSTDPPKPHCTRARIGKRIECLAAGRRCRPKYNHIYGFYGLVCKRAADGTYRLREKIFENPPNPGPTG